MVASAACMLAGGRATAKEPVRVSLRISTVIFSPAKVIFAPSSSLAALPARVAETTFQVPSNRFISVLTLSLSSCARVGTDKDPTIATTSTACQRIEGDSTVAMGDTIQSITGEFLAAKGRFCICHFPGAGRFWLFQLAKIMGV